MPIREACQGVRARCAVAAEDELSVGEPMDRDGPLLRYQSRKNPVPPLRVRGPGLAGLGTPPGEGLGLVPDPLGLGLGLGPVRTGIERHPDRERQGTRGEGELDQDGQDDPRVPPAIER